MGLVRWFWGAVKRMFRKPLFLLFLLLIPAAMLGSAGLKDDADGSVKAVLYAENPDRQMDEVIDKLIAGSDTIEFFRADSEEQVRRLVAAGDAECGYIFSEDLMADLKRQRAKRDIKTIVSQATFLDGIINERVFAGVFDRFAADYLREYEPGAYELYPDYLEDGSTFHFEYETVDGGALAEKAATMKFPVRGLGGLFIWMMSLAAAVLAAADMEAGIFRGISLQGGLVRSYLTIAAMTIICGIDVLLALVLAGEFHPADSAELLVYALACAAYAMIAVLILKKPVRIAALIPVAACAGMICCPIFADLAMFVPAVRYVRILLPVWYIL